MAEDAGLNGWEVINRMASAEVGHVGFLEGLADVLELMEQEKMRLALAYIFEKRTGQLAK